MKPAFPPGILTPDQQERIELHQKTRPFSLFWEVRTLLYLGILFLCGGLGTLVYKNIDHIGHQTLLGALGLAMGGCFWYCGRKAKPFTPGLATADSSWAEYMLLLGVLLFGVFTGYLQARYTVFGTHYGLALGLPAAFYLFLAYRFDHRGVLQLAISGFCAAAGLVTSPMAAIQGGFFNHRAPVWTMLAMGAALAAGGALTERMDFKKHFAFGYFNFALHLSGIAALTGLMMGGAWEKWFFSACIAGLACGLWFYARRKRSAYFLLCAVLYAYVAFTYLFMIFLFRSGSSAGISAAFLYFVVSCAGTIYFFLNLKSFLGSGDAGLSEK
jgi:hypothetical protein